jgi:hypothetical protein
MCRRVRVLQDRVVGNSSNFSYRFPKICKQFFGSAVRQELEVVEARDQSRARDLDVEQGEVDLIVRD